MRTSLPAAGTLQDVRAHSRAPPNAAVRAAPCRPRGRRGRSARPRRCRHLRLRRAPRGARRGERRAYGAGGASAGGRGSGAWRRARSQSSRHGPAESERGLRNHLGPALVVRIFQGRCTNIPRRYRDATERWLDASSVGVL